MQWLTFYEMIFSMYMLSMTKWELDDELEDTQGELLPVNLFNLGVQ